MRNIIKPNLALDSMSYSGPVLLQQVAGPDAPGMTIALACICTCSLLGIERLTIRADCLFIGEDRTLHCVCATRAA